MKKVLIPIAAAAAATISAAPAHAVTFVTENGSTSVFNSSDDVLNSGDVVVNFDDPTPAGISLTLNGAAIVSGSSSTGAQPAFSDGSQYVAVYGGSDNSATIQNDFASGYNSISLFLGSIDTYNTVQILDTAGSVIGSFAGNLFLGGPSGNQVDSGTNRLITFSRAAGDAAFGGIRVLSTSNSAEFDNVRFLSAVPEPATWAMMIFGFLAVGASMRRRKVLKPSFA